MTRNLLYRAAFILAGVAALLYGYTALSEATGFAPRCIIKSLTGISCPGCGSQRAAAALAHGYPVEAWGHNLLLPFIALYAFFVAVLPTGNRLHAALTSPAAIYSLLAVVIAWMIVRNLLSI